MQSLCNGKTLTFIYYLLPFSVWVLLVSRMPRTLSEYLSPFKLEKCKPITEDVNCNYYRLNSLNKLSMGEEKSSQSAQILIEGLTSGAVETTNDHCSVTLGDKIEFCNEGKVTFVCIDVLNYIQFAVQSHLVGWTNLDCMKNNCFVLAKRIYSWSWF